MTDEATHEMPTVWAVGDIPDEPPPGTAVRDRDGAVWHRIVIDTTTRSRWWRAGAIAPLIGTGDAVRRWDQLLLDHGPLTRLEPVSVDATAATIGVGHLQARIRHLQAELSQAVDRSYRDAVRDLVALFHSGSAGLQSLREIGKDDSKITLTDVVTAVRMHVEPNTLGAPAGYVSPEPAVPPGDRQAFVEAVATVRGEGS
ncbi:hypothetical protein GCM10009613_60950 [Pseudonocardia kongjuensis]|uniref:Uncharacterized protein n=1 Tax=Pseudonocardia kongjuensis TaxID=102227 RepID=A0ABN1Y9S1_9PSEU